MRKPIKATIRFMGILLGGTLLASIVPGQARADSFTVYVAKITAIRTSSLPPLRVPAKVERTLALQAYQDYLAQQAAAAVPQVGQVSIDSYYPVAHLDIGDTALLTFIWVNPTTALEGTGPAIGSVLYEANLDPTTPNVYTTIGTSTDAGSDFSLSYLISTFEPGIRATPYDTFGNPIIITGVALDNVAVGYGAVLEVPEPGSLMLLASGLSGLIVRRRTSKS